MKTISQSWNKLINLCLLQVRATAAETQDLTSKIDGIYKNMFPEHSQPRLTFGHLEAKEQQITLRTYSRNLERLQEDLLGYCNLTGIYVRDFPDLSALLFYSKGYRNTKLPYEGIPICAKRTFTNIKIKFKVDVRDNNPYLNPQYNMESDDSDSDEEEEHLL